MTPPRELSAVEELHRHLAELVSSEAAVVESYREAEMATETSDFVSGAPPGRLERGTVVEELHRHLAGHVASEADLIASYRDLAEATDIPEAVRYLIRILLEDEEHHHHLLREMAAAFEDDVPPARHESTAVADLPKGPPSRVLKEVTTRFLAAEREDQQQLRALRRELRPFHNSNLWACLSSSWNSTMPNISICSGTSATTSTSYRSFSRCFA